MRATLRFVLTATALLVLASSYVSRSTLQASVLPSGERLLGKSVLEPAYDDETGRIIYLMTPEKAPFPSKANHNAVSPLYLVVYPTSASSVGIMNCMHLGGDNCPDHGDDIANFAMSPDGMPSVYGQGVWGHDHLVDAPGGSEFNVAWHVIIVLFTSNEAASTHITTDAQLDAAVAHGDAMEFPTDTIFNCQVTSAAAWNRATPWVLSPPALHHP
jgi:hypothetical protein